MYHAMMQSCGMKEMVMNIKTVGKSGQISLGKSLAGMDFVMEIQAGGDILLKHVLVIPANERWLHEPAMKQKLARADDWTFSHSGKESNLDELEASIGGAS